MEQKTEWTKRGQNVLMDAYQRGDKVMTSGQGAYITDVDGKHYLDFISGIAVNALGHANPSMVEALTHQGQTLIHTSNLFWNQPSIEVAEQLTALSGLDKVFFANSGAEVNEGAIKLARKWGRETKNDEHAIEIITLSNSFHGRTLATLTATGQPEMHQKFTPLIPGFRYVDLNDSKALRETVTDKTCAIMIEVIQGEGGINAVSPEFVSTLKELQQSQDVLIIIDEIQTGIARTGTLFAYEQFDLKPDIVTLAKGLGGGLPIGALLATDEVASHFKPGDHGTTFGGNPLATACAKVILDTIKQDHLLDNVKHRSEQLVAGLNQIKADFNSIKDVRGLGLLVGIQFNQAVDSIIQSCYKEGLLVTSAKGNVIRFMPPLNVKAEEIDEGLAILKRVLNNL